MSLEAWLIAAVIGGFLGLDAVSFPQVMIARPLMAGALGGLLAGDLERGLWVGALLEVISMRQLPMGGARYHDTGPAAFAAGLAYAHLGDSSAALLVATATGLVLGWAGSWTVQAQRALNTRLVGSLGGAATPPGRLARRHLGALGLDYLRSAILTGLWILLAQALLGGVEGSERLAGPAAVLIAWAAAGAVGAALRTFTRGARLWQAFAAGTLLSALGVWWWT